MRPYIIRFRLLPGTLSSSIQTGMPGMEVSGLEPLASALQRLRSTN